MPILAPRRDAFEPSRLLERQRARPPRLTAADFTPERMLRPRARPPADGWRRAVYIATGGAVAVGPSPAELRRRELVAQVTTPIRGCRAVAFVSRKGGVGKTTTCLLVGPHLRLPPRRPRRRHRRESGRGNARPPAATRERRDDRHASPRPQLIAQVRGRSRLQLAGTEPTRGDRGRRSTRRRDARARRSPRGGRAARAPLQPRLPRHRRPACSARPRRACSTLPTSS